MKKAVEIFKLLLFGVFVFCITIFSFVGYRNYEAERDFDEYEEKVLSGEIVPKQYGTYIIQFDPSKKSIPAIHADSVDLSYMK